jgi:hypothetical protein
MMDRLLRRPPPIEMPIVGNESIPVSYVPDSEREGDTVKTEERKARTQPAEIMLPPFSWDSLAKEKRESVCKPDVGNGLDALIASPHQPAKWSEAGRKALYEAPRYSDPDPDLDWCLEGSPEDKAAAPRPVEPASNLEPPVKEAFIGPREETVMERQVRRQEERFAKKQEQA